jgi:hypothetical protein
VYGSGAVAVGGGEVEVDTVVADWGPEQPTRMEVAATTVRILKFKSVLIILTPPRKETCSA